MESHFEGQVIGCDASIDVDGDAGELRITLRLPVDRVDAIQRQGGTVMVRSGRNQIWFQTEVPDAAHEAIAAVLGPDAFTTAPEAEPPSGRTWLRRRRG